MGCCLTKNKNSKKLENDPISLESFSKKPNAPVSLKKRKHKSREKDIDKEDGEIDYQNAEALDEGPMEIIDNHSNNSIHIHPNHHDSHDHFAGRGPVILLNNEPNVPKYDNHRDDGPVFNNPRDDSPKYDPSSYEIPSYNPPPNDIPSYDPPNDTPSFNPPTYEIPSYNPPTYEIPSYNPPTYDIPSYDPPSYNYGGNDYGGGGNDFGGGGGGGIDFGGGGGGNDFGGGGGWDS